MAERIIDDWKLAVLRVRLEGTGAHTQVHCRLASYVSGAPRTHWERTDPLSAYGLTNSAEVPVQVPLPPGLVEEAQQAVQQKLADDSVLWLRLEPPYGYLGAALWEDLTDAIDVPMLRVPDVLPVPTPLGSTWRVAAAVNAPADASWGAEHVRDLAAALGSTFGGSVELDVFADAHTHDLLHGQSPAGPATCRVHNPGSARPAHDRRSKAMLNGQFRRPSGMRAFDPRDDPRLLWADWIITGLAGAAVQALHVVTAGVANPERPLLGISRGPDEEMTDTHWASVEAEDVSSLANTLGASVVSIAAPERDGPDVGARMVADRLGQLRPGATIYGSMQRDPGAWALAEVHAFLANPTGKPLPTQASWFGYVQPEAIQQVLAEPMLPHYTGQQVTSEAGERVAKMSAQMESELATTFQDASQVPLWVASTSRFVESNRADLSAVKETPGQGKTSKHAYDRGALTALEDIESMLHRHLGSS